MKTNFSTFFICCLDIMLYNGLCCNSCKATFAYFKLFQYFSRRPGGYILEKTKLRLTRGHIHLCTQKNLQVLPRSWCAYNFDLTPKRKQEGFLRCQTPTSTVRLKVEGCRVKNRGEGLRVKNRWCRIGSEEWRL